MTTTVEHLPGHLLDVHGHGDRGVVLLWHGRGARSRPALTGLGSAIAEHGFRVVVPDWDSRATDGGRAALLGSLHHARGVAESIGTDRRDVVLAGWSLGGTAALGLAAATDEPVARLVLLAPGDGPQAEVPFTGSPLPDVFPRGAGRPPVHLVSPVDDDVVSPELVRTLRSRLSSAGWTTTWTDVAADHWSIAMTRFDDEADRAVSDDREAAVAVGRQVAAIIAGHDASV